MSSDEYQVLFKVADSGTCDLWLFRVSGDVFYPVPNGIQANGSFEISDWRSLDEEALSLKFASQYGSWGGGAFSNPRGVAPSVGPEQYRIRSASPLIGSCYSRIYRPIWNGRDDLLDHTPMQVPFQDYALVRQIDRLTARVIEAAEYIEPTSDTISTYSIALREILILQCTEIETVLQRLLIEHGLSPAGGNWNTSDYVKTVDALHLKEYEVHFPTFPKLTHGFSPFYDWDPAKATQSLIFYDAYNKAKHNREDGLEYATFCNVLLSYAALIIVAYATCGPEIARSQSLQNFINLKTPAWKIDDHYIPIFRVRGSSVDQDSGWSERRDFQFQ